MSGRLWRNPYLLIGLQSCLSIQDPGDRALVQAFVDMHRGNAMSWRRWVSVLEMAYRYRHHLHPDLRMTAPPLAPPPPVNIETIRARG